MQRTKIDEYLVGIKEYAEDSIRHYVNSIGDNAFDVADTVASELFARVPAVNNAHDLYAALEDVEERADYFSDTDVAPQDWAANLSEAELLELLENYGHEVDEYVQETEIEKGPDETFTEHVVRVMQWWYHDTIVSGCTMAMQDIRDRLSDLMCELEDEYGEDVAIPPAYADKIGGAK